MYEYKNYTVLTLHFFRFLHMQAAFTFCFWLLTEPGAVTETGGISQDTYISDICQVIETYVWRL